MNTSVLIYSCDKYSDVWGPFFTLFFRYWKCPYQVYVATESEQCLLPEVKTITVGSEGQWSDIIGRAVKEENPMQRRLHYYVGLFPLIVVLGGVLQFVFPNAPVFCFSCTILMITYFIHSMDTQISTDPLTQLNNRGQLSRYTSQTSKLFIEGRKTYVVMLDINDFKVINDTFGHAEGDHALIMVADALKFVEKSNDVPMFICRYGGDEFIMIVNPVDEREIDKLISDIRSRIDYECKLSETNYKISIGAGYDELLGSNDNVQKCMLRADKKLYIDKEKLKLGQKEG